jgi:hypothetical protein
MIPPGAGAAAPNTSEGRSLGSTTSPLATATARSTAFSSSRTLPGQLCRQSISSPSRERLASGRPSRRATLARKCATRMGMSPARSRNGGSFTVTTLMRK